jgi:putative ABC transport system substrate-binding protein
MIRILCILLFAISAFAEAQQTGRVYRLGYLSSGTASPATDPGFGALRKRLQDLGYMEGQNLHIEYRYAELDQKRLQDFAVELAQLKGGRYRHVPGRAGSTCRPSRDPHDPRGYAG